MNKAIDYIVASKEVVLATIDYGKPRIRVFQIMKSKGSSLFFATSPKKKVYQQLKLTPYVEILAMSNGVSAKADGKVYFDVDDDDAQEIYNTNPVLPRLYSDYKDLVYFRFDIQTVEYYDLNVDPPVTEYFELKSR